MNKVSKAGKQAKPVAAKKNRSKKRDFTDELGTYLMQPKFIWLDNADMQIHFKIGGRTLQSWRSKGVIPFSKILGKLYYNMDDILKMFARFRKTNTKYSKDNMIVLLIAFIYEFSGIIMENSDALAWLG